MQPVQNWKLAEKPALNIDQSAASLCKCDLKLANQGEAWKNLNLVDQPKHIINDLHLHFIEAAMSDVMGDWCVVLEPTLSMVYVMEH